MTHSDKHDLREILRRIFLDSEDHATDFDTVLTSLQYTLGEASHEAAEDGDFAAEARCKRYAEAVKAVIR